MNTSIEINFILRTAALVEPHYLTKRILVFSGRDHFIASALYALVDQN